VINICPLAEQSNESVTTPAIKSLYTGISRLKLLYLFLATLCLQNVDSGREQVIVFDVERVVKASCWGVGRGKFYCVLVSIRLWQPINTLTIPLQYPILDHVTSDSCGVIVVLGDDRVEFLLGILDGGG
jgi:hypothetical protein